MKKKIKHGFTLIEVAVVLLVLVALAGITVPLALGYAQRSHGSSGAGNMAQLTSNINRYEVENFAMPDGWDSLIDADDDTPYDTAFTVFTLGTSGSGADDEMDSLAAAGITTVYNLDADDDDAFTTFGDLSAAETLIAGSILAEISGANVVASLGESNDAADTYLGLGIGENLTAVGNTIATVPYDFPEGAETPEESYRRFVAIFNVSGEKAKFVGVVAVEDGGIANLQDHIAEYYEAGE